MRISVKLSYRSATRGDWLANADTAAIEKRWHPDTVGEAAMEMSVITTGTKVGLWSLCLAGGLSAFLPGMSARQDDFNEDRKIPIQTISTRPDRVSGGDVLVEISGLERKRQPIEIKVNGRDVSSS